jgi:ribosomal protein S18 acetylase RimI-like enzyme
MNHVTFRGIQVDDKDAMISLHHDFFPVSYSSAFFDKMVVGMGLYDGFLYSVIAEDGTGAIVGFLLAQILAYPEQCEDREIFSFPNPENVCYILTLGCVEKYRRKGLGTALIEHCKDYARNTERCGAVSFVILCSFMGYLLVDFIH